jgi:hypothetical protein
MPLDTRLPLAVKQFQPITREQAAAQGFALRGQKRAEDQALQGQREQQTLRDLYQQNSQGGVVDDAGFDQGVAQAGLGDRLPDIQKTRLANQKTGADTQATQFKVAKERADALAGGLASLLANPQVAHQDVYAKLNELVDAGVISQEQGAKAARGLPGNPQQLRPFLVQQALGAADASKRLEAVLPKFDEQNRGGTMNEGTIDPLTGQRTAGVDIQKTLTPGEIQGAENIRNAAAAGVQYQTDANGNFIALPSKPGAGPITPRAVVGADGGNVAGKALNDSQSKALLFASRGQSANKILEELSAKGVNRPSVAKEIAEAVPVIGGALGAGVNATMVSPEQQQVDQAQRDFINATLRRESGAAISPSEFDNARKQYFVQIGDSPQVIEQKKANRELAMRGILAEVPEGMRGQINAPVAPTRARPPLGAIFGGKR